MSGKDIMSSEQWKKSVDFHGHVCPGLAIGFKAAQAGLDKLKERRSEDEELITIVETNACSADAIQVITGCTFGKGNFFHKDYGKHVFTFASRESGSGVRVSLKPDVLQLTDRHRELIDKMRTGDATEAEESEFREIHEHKSQKILGMSPDQLFDIQEVSLELPPKAKIDVSKACDRCGEPTMASMLVETKGGQKLCRDCISTS